MLLDEVLTGLGHIVCASVDSEADAVMAAHEHQPDLILMDAGLRDGSGIATMATINATRRIPHVFMTGDITKVRKSAPDVITIEKPFFECGMGLIIERALAPHSALFAVG